MSHRTYRENTFSLLDQTGPFATGDAPPDNMHFSPQSRKWSSQIRQGGLTTKYRVIRNQIFEFLDLRSFADVERLLKDPQGRRRVNQRAYTLVGNMFGIDGNEHEIISRVNSYAQTADGVIDHLKGRVFARYSPFIEMTNEIEATNSPVDLLMIIFDDRYHKKARFEAKRKLILMNLAASIDQRERETDVEHKFAQFLGFLNDHVWSRRVKIGELEIAYLVSEHDPRTFACTGVQVLEQEQGRELACRPGQKITLIKRRRFRVNGREIPIYVTVRKKTHEAKVLKLLRKGEENPAIAVDDELGLMGVVDSLMDVRIFHKHLTQSASRAGSFMTLEEVSDTLTGAVHVSSNIGSSPKTPMFKFFARMGGMRVEFIVHTNETFLNYAYQREISHDEYEIRRIIDTGVAALLFPPDIYFLDMHRIKDTLIDWFRKRVEEC